MCGLWITSHVFLGLVAEELAIYLYLSEGCKYSRVSGCSLFLYKALFLTFVRLLTTGSSDTAGDVQAGPYTTSYSSFFFFFFSLLPLSTLRILYVITGRKTFSMFISQPQLLLLLFYLTNPFTSRSCEWGVFHLFVFPVYLLQLPWCQSSESLSQWVK